MTAVADGGGFAADRVRWLDRPLASYYLLLGSTGLLLTLGTIMVLSASSIESFAESGSSFTVFQRHVMWLCMGIPALIVATRLPVKFFRWLGYPLLLLSLVLLLLVLVPGFGVTVSGSTRWIDFGPLRVQPSEPAKLALALWGADLLVRKKKLLREWKHLLVPLLPVAALFWGLVMLQPDLGTTLAMVIVVMSLLWVVGAPMRLFATLVTVLLGLVVLMIAIEPYRMRRITGFMDPFADAQDSGYQAVQGIYALASGGWWGLGLGSSREKWDYLPAAHTDYIYAIVGEELGLLGTLVVLLLFATFAYAGMRIARRTTDPFARLVAAAITAWIVGQGCINMGAVVGLLPITGIPLPLISFGGSALIPMLFAIGMLAAIARTEPGARAALASRKPGPVARAASALRPGGSSSGARSATPRRRPTPRAR